ncbi:MAG: hypothetical protein WAW13_03195 [Minisyncoccia bacterium]
MNTQKNSILQNLLAFCVLGTAFFFFSYGEVYGATEKFSPLVGLPGITDASTATLPDYINAIYLTLIGFGALIAVVRISWAGVKYSLSGGNHHLMETAKSDIKGVLIGLAILLIPYLILNTINPELTNLDVLKLAPKIDLKDSTYKPTAAQTAAMNDCLARPGMQWNKEAGGTCTPLVSASEDQAEMKRFCEMIEGYKWSASTTPPTCIPPPSGSKVVP